jgi:Fur family peroxide stress response transcriptional regulator
LTFIIIIVIIIIMKAAMVTGGGRKFSRKREAIMEAIQSTRCHPTAQWVYEQLKPRIPDLSLGTVYRNINLFMREGRLISVGVLNGEEHFDAFTAPHPHFVCERCGKVFDLPCPCGEAPVSFAEDTGGFLPDFRKTVFYGICPECAESAREG